MADTTVSNPIIPQTPPSPGSIDTRYQMTPQEMSGGTAGQTAYNARVSQYYTKPTDDTQPSTTPSTAPPVPATSSTPTVSTAPVTVSSNRTITGPDNQQYTIAPDGQIVGAPTGSTYQAGTNVSQYQDLNDIYQGAVTGKTPNQIQAERQLADYQTKANTALDQLTSIQNGTMPMTQGENAQIAGLQQQFQQMIDQQTKINQGAIGAAQIGGYRTGAAIYDQSFANSMGAIATAGVNKITDLNVKMASAIASMTNSFRTNDFNMAKSAYDEYNTAVKDRQAMIQKIVEDSQKAIDKAAADKAAQEKTLYETVQKPIQDISLEAAKNGLTDPKIMAAIKNAPDVNSAIAAAGMYLQSSSNPDIAKYLEYSKSKTAAGLVPLGYEEYQDQQTKKEAQQKASEAYSTAYSTAAGKAAAEAKYGSSDSTQQKLEQQYRQVLSKEFSSRTGALGIENAKVNQANHLNALITQYYDPKTGNYNIPTSQYAELVMGLANLVAPSGSAEADRAALMAKTASGDLKGALQYITGVPQNGNTQDIIKNLIDSVDRQAQTAVRNRETALQNMRDQAPTDLEQSRIDALNKSTQMAKYEGQDRISKTNVDNYVKANPKEAETIAKLYEVPGATDQDIEAYLKAQGKIK